MTAVEDRRHAEEMLKHAGRATTPEERAQYLRMAAGRKLLAETAGEDAKRRASKS